MLGAAVESGDRIGSAASVGLAGRGGKWNLQEVAELLARAGGAKSGQQSAATSSTPQMPNVRLVDGLVSIIDNKNRTAEISPLAVTGERDTAVSWKYDIQIPSRVSSRVRLVPGGTWGHEVAVKLQDLGAWAKPWMADFPPVVIDANWRGQLTDTGIGGRLDMKKATADLKTGPPRHTALYWRMLPAEWSPQAGQSASEDRTAGDSAVHGGVGNSQLFAGFQRNQARSIARQSLRRPGASIGRLNLNANSGRIDAAWEKLALFRKNHPQRQFFRHPSPAIPQSNHRRWRSQVHRRYAERPMDRDREICRQWRIVLQFRLDIRHKPIPVGTAR